MPVLEELVHIDKRLQIEPLISKSWQQYREWSESKHNRRHLPELIFRLSSYGMMRVVVVGHSAHFTGKRLENTRQSRSLITIQQNGDGKATKGSLWIKKCENRGDRPSLVK